MPTIERILIIALAVLFIHVTTWEGMINYWAFRLTRSWPEWIRKPLLACPICMTPWWGAAMIAAGVIPFLGCREAITVLFAAGGVNAVLNYMVTSNKEIIKDLRDDNKAEP
jgi:hypothetical protein